MPKCIIKECKSEHGKNKNCKEKNIKFFKVPKDGSWKKAVARTNIESGVSVCEKHFPKEDLIFRELKGPKIPVNSDLKVPILRRGAVPSLNLGYSTIKKEISGSESTNDTEDDSILDQFEDLDFEIEKEDSRSKLEFRELLIETRLEIKEETEEVSLFDIIFANERSVVLPPFWSRQNMKAIGERFVIFSHFLPRVENETMEAVCGKQIIINQKLDTEILIMRNKIQKEKTDLKDRTVSSTEDLENILKTVNLWRICSGFKVNNDELKASYVRMDKEGISRSSDCHFCMSAIGKSGCCDNCRRCKRVLARKQARLSKMPSLARLRVNLNGLQQQKLEEMRREIRRLKKAKDRAVIRIESLKTMRIKDKEEFEASKKTLQQLVCESKLEMNQKLIMMEMLSAAKSDDVRGRRYSKRWILFCLTLFKESTSMYKYLRSNHILPLPATQTLFKFEQQNSENKSVPKSDDNPSAIDDIDDFIQDNEIIPMELLPEIEMETEIH